MSSPSQEQLKRQLKVWASAFRESERREPRAADLRAAGLGDILTAYRSSKIKQQRPGSHRMKSPSCARLPWLPQEVVEQIFAYLNFRDLCEKAAVCKTWLAASSVDSLWKCFCTEHAIQGSTKVQFRESMAPIIAVRRAKRAEIRSIAKLNAEKHARTAIRKLGLVPAKQVVSKWISDLDYRNSLKEQSATLRVCRGTTRNELVAAFQN
ncbi:hypothetical protein CYMTET_28133 [Cymbomonas tetramitiformis]|uniref:F-box domain-containing protein n=1 Tax=Cymbomonas tetramitiformis TaxID=36881 RepID=A0AAE0FP12_9CHLO|nr:hypothetical protein CYMTET_28133 [Cymbomonas tetramitiformis]